MKERDITVTSDERPGISRYQQLNYLFKNYFKLTTKKISDLRITGLVLEKPHLWPVNSPS